MSYLNPLRLHFAGQFQADPSTVNNDVRHFNNAAFKPNYQKPGPGATNGWWNPDGTGAFRLVGCKVTSVSYQDGTTSTTDKVVGMQVASAASKAGGKLVDLDPQQQMASAIWGMIVRLTDGSTSGAADFFNGPFAVTSFTDMWNRAQSSQQSDITAGAVYQSVIGPVRWGDVTGSTFLQQLAAAAPDGMLSIKFNIDSYNMSPKSPNFTLGRCVGTIGPATPAEPRRFVLGRQLLPTPASMLNFMPAVLDTSAGRDLSAAKQQTIIRWLTTPGPDGKPLQGTAPVAPAAKTAAAASLAATPPLDDPDPLGSKKLAMRTRGT